MKRSLGATLSPDGSCGFRVWAPRASQLGVRLRTPVDRVVPMRSVGEGYFEVRVEGVSDGDRYLYVIDADRERPDPASRSQPDGVHAASAVCSEAFAWSDAAWFGLPLASYVLYELHVGTFTPEGTFEAIIPRLAALRELGITAVELMPVAQFPGARNWGYDGVQPFAVQASYGGPRGLKALVDACHARGLAVIVDVVYNHLGPEGNYLWDYGPYFTSRHHTPWGDAVNFDGEWSDHVRRFFLESALMLQEEFHVDALRVDAVHAIHDESARPFLQELADETEEAALRANRRFHIIAESDLNDPRLIRDRRLGGMGLSAQWCDDFHHALHALLTGETDGYYADFGSVSMMARAMCEGYAFTGQPSTYRKRRHGAVPWGCDPERFVVCAQNHDQVGNRMHGDRLAALLPFEALKLGMACVALSPFVPLFFMGEEYAETAPFPYFVSHGDAELVAAVRRGRKEEFQAFADRGEPPDPASPATFESARLRWRERDAGWHAVTKALFRRLLELRRQCLPLTAPRPDRSQVSSSEQDRTLVVQRSVGRWHAVLAMNFGAARTTCFVEVPAGTWDAWLDTAAPSWSEDADAPPPVSGPLEQRTTSALGSKLALALAPHSLQLWTKAPPPGTGE